MDWLIPANSFLIWLGGVTAGLAVLAGALRICVSRFENPETKNILGEWIGYACFYSHQGNRYYRERVKVFRNRIIPWKLQIEARPVGTTKIVYAGYVKLLKSYVYSYTEEPVYGDKTFDLGRFVMDEKHGADIIVGLHIGQSYEQLVHSCCAYLWTREFLDADASTLAPSVSGAEIQKFNDLVSPYIQMEPESLRMSLVPFKL